MLDALRDSEGGDRGADTGAGGRVRPERHPRQRGRRVRSRPSDARRTWRRTTPARSPPKCGGSIRWAGSPVGGGGGGGRVLVVGGFEFYHRRDGPRGRWSNGAGPRPGRPLGHTVDP